MNEEYKICSQCKKLKPLDDFTKSKKSKDGHYSSCRECKNRRRLNSKEEQRVKQKERYIKNRDKKLEYQRRYREEHLEDIKKKKRDRHRERMDSDEEYRNKIKSRNKLQKFRRRGCRIGSYTKEEWNECLEFFNYKDAYTGLDMKTISRDHVIPISKGGTSYINNLVPCGKEVNTSKRDKELFEWYSKQEYFDWNRYIKICLWIIKSDRI